MADSAATPAPPEQRRPRGLRAAASAAARARIQAWSARRHGHDALPHLIGRRRVYILPTRAGLMLGAMLAAMLVGGLNYNNNLALALAFLLAGAALVTMHHCNRNLLALRVDAAAESDSFAGGRAPFHFTIGNDGGVGRRDIELSCLGASAQGSVPPRSLIELEVSVPTPTRGVQHVRQFELNSRYPFGWFRTWTYVHAELTAFVAPAPRGERALPATAGEGSEAASEARGEDDFAGLKAYEPGVPLKHMAWKALARGGEPAVRSYAGAAARAEWLEFDSLEDLGVEARLSQLCRWVLDGDQAGRAYGLRIPGREIPPSRGPAHRRACLRALASFGS